MKRILDASFRYTPSFDTNLRKTFERIKRQQRADTRAQEGPAPDTPGNVLPIQRQRVVKGSSRSGT